MEPHELWGSSQSPDRVHQDRTTIANARIRRVQGVYAVISWYGFWIRLWKPKKKRELYISRTDQQRQISACPTLSTFLGPILSAVPPVFTLSLPATKDMGFSSIRSLALLWLVATSVPVASGLPKTKCDSVPKCTELNQRKAWSALTDDEKSRYIDAELCLQNRPAVLGIEGAKNRWDELMYGHIVQSNIIHDVGAFLPWHRLYMRAHEIILQTECGYQGAQPYWDELADRTAGELEAASVLDADTGFGTGDVGEDGCIVNGPFVNLTMHLNQTSNEANYCLSRKLASWAWDWANSTWLDACYATDNYEDAWQCFIFAPHTAGHGSIGGTMLDVVASPGDPLFFLHHTYLDRVWWRWQQQDLPTRLTDMSGRNIPLQTYLDQNNFDYPSTAVTDYFNDGGNETTLSHTLWMAGLMPNATIGDVMDLGGDLICAEYIG
ncbi:putative Tyrosinase copper-binding domain-containing protein [Seiridium cardinale]